MLSWANDKKLDKVYIKNYEILIAVFFGLNVHFWQSELSKFISSRIISA